MLDKRQHRAQLCPETIRRPGPELGQLRAGGLYGEVQKFKKERERQRETQRQTERQRDRESWTQRQREREMTEVKEKDIRRQRRKRGEVKGSVI